MTSARLSVLIAFAGLPGTGKSTLARALAARLDAPVLDKDAVRAALFGSSRTDYSRTQDDLCMRAIHDAAAYLVAAQAGAGSGSPAWRVAAILDGRTYIRHESVGPLLDAALQAGAALLVVECRCSDAVAEARLHADAARGAHPAANRDIGLYRSLRDSAEPLAAALAPAIAASAAAAHGAPGGARIGTPVMHLVLDTGGAAKGEDRAGLSGAAAGGCATPASHEAERVASQLSLVLEALIELSRVSGA